jgi:hypothetical protein
LDKGLSQCALTSKEQSKLVSVGFVPQFHLVLQWFCDGEGMGIFYAVDVAHLGIWQSGTRPLTLNIGNIDKATQLCYIQAKI